MQNLSFVIRPLTSPTFGCNRTYVRIQTGFLYLAAILDAFSRLCVGWHLSRDIDTRLTLAALEMALRRRRPPAGLIHPSDRGVQYASEAYVSRLEQAKVLPSMAGRGNPYENAQAESFFKTLKREEVYLTDYRTFQEAEQNIGPFIEAVYNQKRLHSSLRYLPPAEPVLALRSTLAPDRPGVGSRTLSSRFVRPFRNGGYIVRGLLDGWLPCRLTS